jgi:tetratricopeptide (TPR) repeat protein
MMKQRKIWILLSILLGLLVACNRDPKVQAQRYLENGNKFFARDKFKEASIMYRRALQKDLRYGEAYYRLGLTDLKLQAYAEAAKMLLRAVELQPNNGDAATKLADLYLVAAIQGGPQQPALIKEVKELADKLVTQNPKSFDGHRILGQLALLDRDPQAAIKEFEIANRIQPNQSDVVLSYFQALTVSKQFPEAEKLALDFLQKEKTYSAMYDMLYLEYARQKRLDDGEKLLKLKVENNPLNGLYVKQLATHYFLSKDRPSMDAVMQKLNNEKDFPDGHLIAGDFYLFNLREYDNAQRQYVAGEKAFPKSKGLYQRRQVELLAMTGKNKEANDLLAQISKENPNDSDAMQMRAALRVTTGNSDQINLAVNDLQSLVTKNPENHLLRFDLGRALAAQGKLDAAVLQLEEAIKIRPDMITAREMLARIYLAKGDAKALKAAEDTLRLDPNNLQAHLVRASSLLGTSGDKDKAKEELAYITKAFPQNAEARYMVGALALQEKDYTKATETFGALHHENPKDIRGLVGVVETLASQNKMPDALKEIQKSIEAEPERRDLQLAYGDLLLRSEKYDESIKVYQQLVDKDPKSVTLVYRLGEAYRRKGDLNSAIDAFRKASQASPNNPDSLLQLGLLMEGTGKRDQAKPIYEQILKIVPDNPIALNNLAYIKAEEGNDLDQALTMAQQALKKAPSSPDIADTLGWIYIKKNLSDDAVRVYKDLVAKDPSNPTFHYHFGMALLQKGDRPSAKQELEKAIQNKPSKDDDLKIRELLQKI